MASRKREKEARRQERVQAEQEAEAEARRRRLFAALAAAALAAAIVVAVLVVVSQSGDDDGGGQGGDLEGAGLVEAEFADVPQRGTVAGEPDSEVTIVEYGDLQCPACAQFSETVIPDVINDLVRPGEAAIEFRNFTIIGPDSEVAARAALAASEQDRYWQFVELFYRNQGLENGGYISDEFLRDVAAGAGVPDLDAWEQAREDPKWDERLGETQRLAQQAGFNSTPSILVEGPGGSEPLGSIGSVEEIAAAVERALSLPGGRRAR